VDDINSTATDVKDTMVFATLFFPMEILILVRNEVKMKIDAARLFVEGRVVFI